MRQKSHESAADFLVRVSGGVDGLARDWKGVGPLNTRIKALLSEVFINGVSRGVLDMFLTLRWLVMESSPRSKCYKCCEEA